MFSFFIKFSQSIEPLCIIHSIITWNINLANLLIRININGENITLFRNVSLLL